MDLRRPPEFSLDLVADRTGAKDVLVAVLHTIFFHRLFGATYPSTHEVLDVTLPYVSEHDDIETTIEQRVSSFLRELETSVQSMSSYSSNKRRGQLTLHFLEKKRKKSGWFVAKADEETIWEVWNIDVTVMGARSEPEAVRNRALMERSLEDAAFKVLDMVNEERSHIPPITSNDPSPFPFQILFNAKG